MGSSEQYLERLLKFLASILWRFKLCLKILSSCFSIHNPLAQCLRFLEGLLMSFSRLNCSLMQVENPLSYSLDWPQLAVPEHTYQNPFFSGRPTNTWLGFNWFCEEEEGRAVSGDRAGMNNTSTVSREEAILTMYFSWSHVHLGSTNVASTSHLLICNNFPCKSCIAF